MPTVCTDALVAHDEVTDAPRGTRLVFGRMHHMPRADPTLIPRARSPALEHLAEFRPRSAKAAGARRRAHRPRGALAIATGGLERVVRHQAPAARLRRLDQQRARPRDKVGVPLTLSAEFKERSSTLPLQTVGRRRRPRTHREAFDGPWTHAELDLLRAAAQVQRRV